MSYITYIDQQGRNVIGRRLSQANNDYIVVENPVMISVQPQPQTGKLEVQLIPLFFGEFIQPNEEGDRTYTFNYPSNSIVVGEGFTIDKKITDQYDKIILATFKKAVDTPTRTVKLFADE